VGKRVVAGRTDADEWGILASGPPASVVALEGGGSFTFLWKARSASLAPEDLTTDAAGNVIGLAPGQSQFSIVRFPPTDAPGWWHRNNTVDYQFVVAGAILLQMEDGSEAELEAGDANVQLGGTHRWWNRSSTECVLAIVQLGVDAPGLEPFNERSQQGRG
jgi:quercetin dioxygenase-like cupin family protein